jgi:hypothetical protein
MMFFIYMELCEICPKIYCIKINQHIDIIYLCGYGFSINLSLKILEGI